MNLPLHGMESLQRALDAAVTHGAGALRPLEQLTGDAVTAAGRAAAQEVLGMGRDFLIQNLAASGLYQAKPKRGHAYGALRAAVRGVTVRLTRKGLRFELPAGRPDHFYEYAAALNYGAVRQPRAVRPVRDAVTGRIVRQEKRGLLGDAAKRTLKRIAFGAPVSARALASLAGGIHGRNVRRAGFDIGAGPRNVTAASVVVGSAVVIKPRRYLYFTAAQATELRTAFAAALQSKLKLMHLSRRAA